MRRAIPYAVVAVVGLSPACATSRSTPARVDDDEIDSRVARRFMADGRVSWVDIDVDTIDAVVTLRGVTDDPEERRRAEELAARTPGVREVVNRITIGPESTDILDGNPDAWITMKVKAALALNATVTAGDIDVDTSDRWVTLSGIVDTDAEKRQAVEVARSIDGVERVVDELTVKRDATSPAESSEPTLKEENHENPEQRP